MNSDQSERIRTVYRDTINAAPTRADRMMLNDASRATVFGYALNRKWIDRATYDEARQHYGNLWNYTGD